MIHARTLAPALAVAALFSLLNSACINTGSAGKAAPAANADENLSSLPAFARVRDLAGSATSADSSSSLSFNVPVPGLNEKESEIHLAGDAEFSRVFNTEAGVGPAFNANTCVVCHARDGRGSLPVIPAGKTSVKFGANESLLLRISLETMVGSRIESKLVPGFTEQLHQRGIFSLRTDAAGSGQADIEMSFTTSNFTYPDGHIVELRKPVFKITNPYDAVGGKKSALEDPDLRMSPRIGPPMIGLGLIELIDARDIIALADPFDTDGDGISGRPNFVDGKLGRFGWKANNNSIRQQVAGAFSNDMGLRSAMFPNENISGTSLFDDLLARLGVDWKPAETEISETLLDNLEFYTATLAVPARRNVDNPRVLRGAAEFERASCTACHVPSFQTPNDAKVAALRGLTIYPFSDGLLHDMGSELADDRMDHEADGREWKTRPLWGIGMTQTVNPRAGFLHDGRARTLEEAVLYHGGEAAESRRKFADLPRTAREDLLLFLKSL